MLRLLSTYAHYHTQTVVPSMMVLYHFCSAVLSERTQRSAQTIHLDNSGVEPSGST